ncbi:hypothetical protein T439DRAFT_381266 [Meredithblackwellia eburnea MCA 4105]
MSRGGLFGHPDTTIPYASNDPSHGGSLAVVSVQSPQSPSRRWDPADTTWFLILNIGCWTVVSIFSVVMWVGFHRVRYTHQRLDVADRPNVNVDLQTGRLLTREEQGFWSIEHVRLFIILFAVSYGTFICEAVVMACLFSFSRHYNAWMEARREESNERERRREDRRRAGSRGHSPDPYPNERRESWVDRMSRATKRERKKAGYNSADDFLEGGRQLKAKEERQIASEGHRRSVNQAQPPPAHIFQRPPASTQPAPNLAPPSRPPSTGRTATTRADRPPQVGQQSPDNGYRPPSAPPPMPSSVPSNSPQAYQPYIPPLNHETNLLNPNWGSYNNQFPPSQQVPSNQSGGPSWHAQSMNGPPQFRHIVYGTPPPPGQTMKTNHGYSPRSSPLPARPGLNSPTYTAMSLPKPTSPIQTRRQLPQITPDDQGPTPVHNDRVRKRVDPVGLIPEMDGTSPATELPAWSPYGPEGPILPPAPPFVVQRKPIATPGVHTDPRRTEVTSGEGDAAGSRGGVGVDGERNGMREAVRQLYTQDGKTSKAELPGDFTYGR